MSTYGRWMEKFERNGRGMKLVWLRRKWGSTSRRLPSFIFEFACLQPPNSSSSQFTSFQFIPFMLPRVLSPAPPPSSCLYSIRFPISSLHTHFNFPFFFSQQQLTNNNNNNKYISLFLLDFILFSYLFSA